MHNFDPEPVQNPDGFNPKTHTPRGLSVPPPRSLPPMSPITNMTPSRVPSSIPEGNEGDDVDRIETLGRKYRKALNPTPIEGIEVGVVRKCWTPGLEFLISNFKLPPPLQDVADPSKVTHKFLPKQGEIDRLIKQINKKVLRDTKLSMNVRDLKTAYLTSPHFRDIYQNLTQKKFP